MKNVLPGIIAKRLFTTLLLSCWLIFTSGCSDTDQQFGYIPEGGTILAFGDSLTKGVGASPGADYPAQLQKLTARRIINAGVSGEETQAGKARLPALLQQHTPELLILMEGGNDILRNRNYSQIRDNLAAMIEAARTRNIPVLLIAVPEKKLFSDSAPFYPELAEQYPVVFADEILADLLRTPRYKSDPIHLNDLGYKQLAVAIQQLLIEHNAL